MKKKKCPEKELYEQKLVLLFVRYYMERIFFFHRRCCLTFFFPRFVCWIVTLSCSNPTEKVAKWINMAEASKPTIPISGLDCISMPCHFLYSCSILCLPFNRTKIRVFFSSFFLLFSYSPTQCVVVFSSHYACEHRRMCARTHTHTNTHSHSAHINAHAFILFKDIVRLFSFVLFHEILPSSPKAEQNCSSFGFFVVVPSSTFLVCFFLSRLLSLCVCVFEFDIFRHNCFMCRCVFFLFGFYHVLFDSSLSLCVCLFSLQVLILFFVYFITFRCFSLSGLLVDNTYSSFLLLFLNVFNWPFRIASEFVDSTLISIHAGTLALFN